LLTKWATFFDSYIYESCQNLYSDIHSRIAYNITRVEVRSHSFPPFYPSLTSPTEEHKANNFMLLRSKMRRLPAVHLATLRAILEHLARVVNNSDKNKMDAKNLSIVFGGVIFGEDEMPKGGAELLSVQSFKVCQAADSESAEAFLLTDPPPPFFSPSLPVHRTR
jgi:hypothetical protein